MNLYTKEESDKINKKKEINDKTEDFFSQKREEIIKTVTPILESLSLDLSKPENSKKILEAQSLALTIRMQLNDQINFFLNKRSRESTTLKKLKQEKFIHYAVSFGIKTNMGEKIILIEGHLGEYERSAQLIEAHIDFLRDSIKSLENFGYSIKNMIDLLGYLNRN
jgi:hypothetical protein